MIRGFSEEITWIFKIFKNFMKIEFWWRQIFEILIFHKPSLWSRDVPQKIWARSVQPFWRLLDTNKQTNKQTDRQAKFIYRYGIYKLLAFKHFTFLRHSSLSTPYISCFNPGPGSVCGSLGSYLALTSISLLNLYM